MPGVRMIRQKRRLRLTRHAIRGARPCPRTGGALRAAITIPRPAPGWKPAEGQSAQTATAQRPERCRPPDSYGKGIGYGMVQRPDRMGASAPAAQQPECLPPASTRNDRSHPRHDRTAETTRDPGRAELADLCQKRRRCASAESGEYSAGRIRCASGPGEARAGHRCRCWRPVVTGGPNLRSRPWRQSASG
jgi:hypothetical protein